MYRIIYMKADYEPWWQFDGWQEYIVEEKTFEDYEKAKNYLNKMIERFKQRYTHYELKKDRFWAFWSDDEIQFCEACDDDIQTYHGIIWEELK